MIVAEQKPIDQIYSMLEPFEKILIVGCGTCVSVCLSGGEKEVQILAETLRAKAGIEGKKVDIGERTVTRQCDREYLELVADVIDQYDVVLSTACGAGVQFLAERYDDKIVLPALNTLFIGVAEDAGFWKQKCMACSDCVLDQTGGVCPMTICAKNLLNGPCGGTDHGKCEVDSSKDCAWTLIYRKMEKIGRLDYLEKIQPPKNYQVMTKPAKYTHEAYQAREES